MEKQKFNKKFTKEDYVGYFGVIYKITNTINNKLYIGQTVDFNHRIRSHEETGFNKNAESYNNPLYRAIRKYGINNFEIYKFYFEFYILNILILPYNDLVI